MAKATDRQKSQRQTVLESRQNLVNGILKGTNQRGEEPDRPSFTQGTWSYDAGNRVIRARSSAGQDQLIAALFSGTPETHANGKLLAQARSMRQAFTAIRKGREAMVGFCVRHRIETKNVRLDQATPEFLVRLIATYFVVITDPTRE